MRGIRGGGEKGVGGGERTGPPCYRCIRAKPYSLPFPFPLPPRDSTPLFHSLFRFEPAPATLLCTESFRDHTLQILSQWCSSNPTSAGPFCRTYIDICVYVYILLVRAYVCISGVEVRQRISDFFVQLRMTTQLPLPET